MSKCCIRTSALRGHMCDFPSLLGAQEEKPFFALYGSKLVSSGFVCLVLHRETMRAKTQLVKKTRQGLGFLGVIAELIFDWAWLSCQYISKWILLFLFRDVKTPFFPCLPYNKLAAPT